VTTRLKLVVSEAFRSMGANLSTSFAAATTVLIGMFLLGLLIALGTWVVSWSDHVKNQLEVKVYFTDGVHAGQVNAVGSYLRTLRADGQVSKYRFLSRAEALEIMKKRNPDLVKSLPANPLPASYTVTPAKPELVKSLSQGIRTKFKTPVCKNGIGNPNAASGVECVKDGEQTSKRILQVARVIEVVFVVAVLILLIASVLLIANTIRLSIFARRREIEVMKLVGATNWFVRGPFMVEGLLCGVMGAVAAVVLLFLGKEIALPAILGHIDTTNDVRALGFTFTALILLVVGLVVGAVGSGFTLRRYLKI
jgi:cell division transport system permease protein